MGAIFFTSSDESEVLKSLLLLSHVASPPSSEGAAEQMWPLHFCHKVRRYLRHRLQVGNKTSVKFRSQWGMIDGGEGR